MFKLLLIALIFIFLIGLGVVGIVLRAFLSVLYRLRGKTDAGRGPGRGTRHAPPFGRRFTRPADKIERVLACSSCGVHVPESEGVQAAGKFFCCEHCHGRGKAGGQ